MSGYRQRHKRTLRSNCLDLWLPWYATYRQWTRKREAHARAKRP